MIKETLWWLIAWIITMMLISFGLGYLVGTEAEGSSFHQGGYISPDMPRISRWLGIPLLSEAGPFTNMSVAEKAWTLPKQKEYKGVVFQKYVLTNLGTFAVYQTSVGRLNWEVRKRMKHISFAASAFSDLDAMEVWYTDEESLRAELKNIVDKESFRKALRQDEAWEAEHKHEEMMRWLNDRHYRQQRRP